MKLQSQIRVLSEAEMDRIFGAAVDVVKSVSMMVQHEKMLQTLRDYGCEIDMRNQMVKFPEVVLQNLLDDIEKQRAKAREAQKKVAEESHKEGVNGIRNSEFGIRNYPRKPKASVTPRLKAGASSSIRSPTFRRKVSG